MLTTLYSIIVAWALAAPADAAGCTIGRNDGPFDERTTLLLVEPTGDSAKVFLHHFDWYDWAGQDGAGPAPADSTWGAVFRVREVDSGAAGPTGISRGEEVVIVPWRLAASCDPLPWAGDLDWTRFGDQVIAAFFVRKASSNPMPVIDVIDELHFFPFPFPWQDNPDEWLTPAEYFDAVTSLPRAGPFSPDEVLEALDRWASEVPGASDRIPIRNIRSRWRRSRSRSRGGLPN